MKIGNSYMPKTCRCADCEFKYNEYRQEEAIAEALDESRFWQRVRNGEIDENGNEIDE